MMNMKLFPVILLLLLSCAVFGQVCCTSPGTQPSASLATTNTTPHAESSPATENANTSANITIANDGTSPTPNDARGYFEKGSEDYKRNRDRAAAEAFEQALRLQPEFPEVRLRLGLAYTALDRKEEAEMQFEAAVKQYKDLLRRQPEDADAHFNLGVAYDKLGKLDDALKAHKQAVRFAPDDSGKQYELGLALTKLAQYKEAVAALERAINLDPDNFRAVDALDRAKAGLARREAFLKQLEKAQQRKTEKQQPSPIPVQPPGIPSRPPT